MAETSCLVCVWNFYQLLLPTLPRLLYLFKSFPYLLIMYVCVNCIVVCVTSFVALVYLGIGLSGVLFLLHCVLLSFGYFPVRL